MKYTIYHNPRCRKSRETLALLESKKKEVEVVLYLESPPDEAKLTQLIKYLGISAHDLIRKEESVFKENIKGRQLTEKQLIQWMAKHPILIQRPIVVAGSKAVIGRPPELVLTL